MFELMICGAALLAAGIGLGYVISNAFYHQKLAKVTVEVNNAIYRYILAVTAEPDDDQDEYIQGTIN